MAQAMIEIRLKKKDTSTQTGDNFDFTFLLSKTKTVRLYKSRSYKDYVLSLSLNRSKKLIRWDLACQKSTGLQYQFI